ncbi:hypothetical protein QNN95_16190 (plasmid) [Exiguobacterium acetylicum]
MSEKIRLERFFMEKPQEERWKVIEIEEAVRRWRGGCLTPRAAMELIE